MLTIHLPHDWTHARPRSGVAPVTPWLLATAALVAINAVVLAAGWQDWGVPEWLAVITAVVTAAGTVGTGIVAGTLKILNAIHALRADVQQSRQQAAAGAAQAATTAVSKAIDASALPTTDEQRAEFLRDLAAEVVRQQRDADVPRVRT